MNSELAFKKQFNYLLKKIGPTILGVKPAELRNIKLNRFDSQSGRQIWNKCKARFLAVKELQIVKVRESEHKKKVLFYHTTALDNYLKRRKVLNFLQEKVDYPDSYSLKRYVNHLTNRLRNCALTREDFPHEIGLFLGYPLKDVLGYMGYEDLELSCSREWKMYGNTFISLRQKEKFDAVRELFE